MSARLAKRALARHIATMSTFRLSRVSLLSVATLALLACSAATSSTAPGADTPSADTSSAPKSDRGGPDVDPADTSLEDTASPRADVGEPVLEAPPLPACLGVSVPLVVSGQGLPYATATVGGAPGWFLLDFATTSSTIDEGAFQGAVAAIPGTGNQYGAFDFFGPWGAVRLDRQDHSGVSATVRQAGILGTDFLSLHVYTLDFRSAGTRNPGIVAQSPGWAVYRAPGGGCDDATLTGLGLRAVSTEGHYSNDLSEVQGPNVPTVPVRVGGASAVAQLDTGFDDVLVPGSVNVNEAFFDAIPDAARGTRRPDLDLALTTCVGIAETVEAWAPDAPFEFVGPGGETVREVDGVVLFVKRTPAAAAPCGGIGTWDTPAAQVGATILSGSGVLVFDPLTSRVWMAGSANE
ncbi:MAG: hypothetical protein IV100_30625 [Myxococcales bacterium]|nr:hypothetical protein [Myxococcales bacterium]